MTIDLRLKSNRIKLTLVDRVDSGVEVFTRSNLGGLMGWIKSTYFKAGVVLTAALGDLQVTTAKLALLGVGSAQLAAAAVTEPKLAADQRRQMVFKYSFATQGGTQVAKTMTDAAGAAQQLPANAVIHSVTSEVETAFTSGGLATVQFGITGADQRFLAATAFDNASLAIDVASAANASVPIKVGAAATNVLMTIATADLTAGVVYLYVEYTVGH